MKSNFLGKISWSKNPTLKEENNVLTLDHVCLSIERNSPYSFSQKSYTKNKENGLLVAMLGHLSNVDTLRKKHGTDLIDDVDIIAEYYLEYGKKNKKHFITGLDGIFLIFIYDQKLEKIFVFQSVFGFSLPIYYHSNDDEITIGTNLKQLLLNTEIKREFDQQAVNDFFGSSMITYKKTLIKGIKKLVTHSYMDIDMKKHSFSINPSSNKVKRLNKDVAKEYLVESIINNTVNLANSMKSPVYHTTLTRGWDSNLMFHGLKDIDYEKINIYTIDGGNEYSEVPEVKKILKNEKNITLFTQEINWKIMDFLPDMVWKYEGYVFERGMFLRYELAKHLLKNKGNHIFIGSGADPILDSNMGPGGNRAIQKFGFPSFKSIKQTLKMTIRKGLIGDLWFTYKNKDTPMMRYKRKTYHRKNKLRYNLEIDYNLKMHDILFNQFGIFGIYPFLNKETVSASNILRKFNKGKAFYKIRLQKLFGEKKAGLIKKTGQVLDVDRIYFEQKQLLIPILNSNFMEKIITDTSYAKSIRENPDNYIPQVMQIAYLFLFDYLFLQNKYDHLFQKENFDLSLSQLLKEWNMV